MRKQGKYRSENKPDASILNSFHWQEGIPSITYSVGGKFRQYYVSITHEPAALAMSSRAGIWNAANLIIIRNSNQLCTWCSVRKAVMIHKNCLLLMQASLHQ